MKEEEIQNIEDQEKTIKEIAIIQYALREQEKNKTSINSLISGKWIWDLQEFINNEWWSTNAFNELSKQYQKSWDVDLLKQMWKVLEYNTKDFKFLRDINEERKNIYKNIIKESSIKNNFQDKAYWLAKLWDILLKEWNSKAAFNNYESIFLLWEKKWDLKIIELWSLRLLQIIEPIDELFSEVLEALITVDIKHLLTVWNFHEERDNYKKALENYIMAKEHNLTWANDLILEIIETLYLKENKKDSTVDEIIMKLEKNTKFLTEDYTFIRSYINF